MKTKMIRFKHTRTNVAFHILGGIQGDRYDATTGNVRVVIEPHLQSRMFRDSFTDYTVNINGVRLADRYETPHDAARAAVWFIGQNLPWQVDGFTFEEQR